VSAARLVGAGSQGLTDAAAASPSLDPSGQCRSESRVSFGGEKKKLECVRIKRISRESKGGFDLI
jgi:hypothetical protein